MTAKTNLDVLTTMAAGAKERSETLDHRLMQERSAYIRVNGAGFRAVSVAPDSPLSGFSRRTKVTLASAVKDTRDEATGIGKAVERLKEYTKVERSLQAHIIRKALENRGDLRQVLGGEALPFDELTFAFDEVSLNRSEDETIRSMVRCDLLAVGKFRERYEPVLIELKYRLDGTLLNVLKKQLKAFITQMQSDRHKAPFKRLLEAATGHEVSMERVHAIIAWPEEAGDQTASKLAQRMIDQGVGAVVFTMEAKRAAQMRRFGEARVVSNVTLFSTSGG